MIRWQSRPVPLSPESEYDRRLQQHLTDTYRDLTQALARGVASTGDTMSGNLTVARADPEQESAFVAQHVGATAQIAMLSRSSTAGTYGVFGPNTAGIYTSGSMRFLADSGSAFEWGWPNEVMSLRRSTPGGVESATLNLGTLLPNIYMRGDPALGSGLRIHYNDAANLAVIDTAVDLVIRDGSGAEIFTFSPSRKTVKYAILGSDPAAPADGEMWYLNGTGFRRRANGVTATF
jgi:hypothetical protein